MGYLTYHTLVIGGEEGHEVSDEHSAQILDRLGKDEVFRGKLEDFHEGGMNGPAKWYEHDRDMLRLSRAFPEVLLVLWREGEEPKGSVEDLLPRRVDTSRPGPY